MKQYHTLHLVKGEDLNHHGTLFAARTASWFVESAFAAAAITHGNSEEILCRNIHGMSFKIPVHNGDLVEFSSRVVYAGKTSLTVQVLVTSELTRVLAVEGYITFVTTSRLSGLPIAHGIVLDETNDPDELAAREKAASLRKH